MENPCGREEGKTELDEKLELRGWWKKKLGIVDGEDGRWFWDNLARILGDGGRHSLLGGCMGGQHFS